MDKDFGNDYVEFYPAANGEDKNGMPVEASKVCIDGWFTAAQLRNIAEELDRLENEMKVVSSDDSCCDAKNAYLIPSGDGYRCSNCGTIRK